MRTCDLAIFDSPIALWILSGKEKVPEEAQVIWQHDGVRIAAMKLSYEEAERFKADKERKRVSVPYRL